MQIFLNSNLNYRVVGSYRSGQYNGGSQVGEAGCDEHLGKAVIVQVPIIKLEWFKPPL